MYIRKSVWSIQCFAYNKSHPLLLCFRGIYHWQSKLKVVIFLFIIAVRCFTESVYPDANAVRNCSDSHDSCTSTCNDGYMYGDGDTTKTFTCTGNNNWDFNYPFVLCLRKYYYSKNCRNRSLEIPTSCPNLTW